MTTAVEKSGAKSLVVDYLGLHQLPQCSGKPIETPFPLLGHLDHYQHKNAPPEFQPFAWWNGRFAARADMVMSVVPYRVHNQVPWRLCASSCAQPLQIIILLVGKRDSCSLCHLCLVLLDEVLVNLGGGGSKGRCGNEFLAE